MAALIRLEIYKGLNVPEVWFWKTGKFAVYHLQDQVYQWCDRSQFLPDLDLNLLATLIQSPEPLDAVLEFRTAIHQQLQQESIHSID